MTDWKSIKKAAAEDPMTDLSETAKRDMAYLKSKQEVQGERDEFGKQLDTLKDEAEKGTVGYGAAGAVISPALYSLVQYLRGKKITPMGLTGSSIAGYLTGLVGKQYYNQTRPEWLSRYNTAATGYNKREQLLQMLEFKHQMAKAEDLVKKNSSEINLVEKVAKDLEELQGRHLKRNAEYLKKLMLEGKTVDVYDLDGNPGVVNGIRHKEEE